MSEFTPEFMRAEAMRAVRGEPDHVGTVSGLRLRKVMGRTEWEPPRPYGPNGWSLRHRDGVASVIVSSAPDDDGVEWVHASMTRSGELPSYEDLCRLHQAVFGDGFAYQAFVPRAEHVNIHEHALHLWGRLDGKPAIPMFSMGGSI